MKARVRLVKARATGRTEAQRNALLQKKVNRIWQSAAPSFGAASAPPPKVWQGQFHNPQEAESVYKGSDGANRTGIKFGGKLVTGLLNPNSKYGNLAKETLIHEEAHQRQAPRPITAKNAWEVEGGAETFARRNAPSIYKRAGISYHNPKYNGYQNDSRKVANQKGEKWIQKGQMAPVFTSEEQPGAYKRNKVYAKASTTGYQTKLNSTQEAHFREWLRNHSEGGHRPGGFKPNAEHEVYDMRGYWLSLVRKGKLQQGRAGEGGAHFPDAFKTPYDPTFSKWSKYAKPGTPLVWRKGNRLVNRKTGRVVFQEPRG